MKRLAPGISRRSALKTLGAAAAAAGAGRVADVAAAPQRAADPVGVDALLPLAEATLPSELGADGHREAAAAFVRWLRNYKEGADTDHGYGNTRIRATGPSPARNYASQLASLDDAARAKGAQSFPAAPIETRRTIVEGALAAAKIDRLSNRPNGAHVAADLMAHYFNSPAAEDLCYRRAIGRDTCRGLPGSEQPPSPLRK